MGQLDEVKCMPVVLRLDTKPRNKSLSYIFNLVNRILLIRFTYSAQCRTVQQKSADRRGLISVSTALSVLLGRQKADNYRM